MIWSASWCMRRSKGAAGGPYKIVTEVLLLLIGGDETTRHTLSGGQGSCCCIPISTSGWWATCRWLPNAIEEMLRWTAPVKNMARTITADTEFHGTQLHKDEKIILLFESANFDEKVFEEPESFNIERYPNNHLAFASARTSVRQPARPTRAVDHANPAAAASAGYAPGVSRCASAVATGELRVRPGEDAGGIHADRTSGVKPLRGQTQTRANLREKCDSASARDRGAVPPVRDRGR